MLAFLLLVCRLQQWDEQQSHQQHTHTHVHESLQLPARLQIPGLHRLEHCPPSQVGHFGSVPLEYLGQASQDKDVNGHNEAAGHRQLALKQPVADVLDRFESSWAPALPLGGAAQ